MQALGDLPLAQLRATTGPAEGTPGAASTATPTVSAPVTSQTPVVAPVAGTQGAITSSAGTAGPTSQEAPKGGILGSLGSFLPIILMMVVLYFVMFRGQKKTEKKRKAMLSEMKKGDQVMTIGGLVARIVSIDDDQVVLKIDESANVKATYKKSAIQQVLLPDEKK